MIDPHQAAGIFDARAERYVNDAWTSGMPSGWSLSLHSVPVIACWTQEPELLLQPKHRSVVCSVL